MSRTVASADINGIYDRIPFAVALPVFSAGAAVLVMRMAERTFVLYIYVKNFYKIYDNYVINFITEESGQQYYNVIG